MTSFWYLAWKNKRNCNLVNSQRKQMNSLVEQVVIITLSNHPFIVGVEAIFTANHFPLNFFPWLYSLEAVFRSVFLWACIAIGKCLVMLTFIFLASGASFSNECLSFMLVSFTTIGLYFWLSELIFRVISIFRVDSRDSMWQSMSIPEFYCIHLCRGNT